MTGAAPLAASAALALCAAAVFAVASSLQQRSAREAPSRDALRPRLILDLLRSGRWLLGALAGGFGFLLQAVALYLGPVALVQPLVVTELLFALPIVAHLGGLPPHRREWTGAALVVAGVATFLIVASPAEERTEFVLNGSRLPIVIAVAGGVIVLSLLVASRCPGMVRTCVCAASAGLAFGLMSPLVKLVGTLFADHGIGAVATWEPWTLGAVAAIGVVQSQNAFQAGPLAVSLPIIDTLEPVSAIVIAVVAFEERLATGPVSVALELAATAVAVAGIVVLDTSPLVLRAQGRQHEPAHRSDPPLDRDP